MHNLGLNERVAQTLFIPKIDDSRFSPCFLLPLILGLKENWRNRGHIIIFWA